MTEMGVSIIEKRSMLRDHQNQTICGEQVAIIGPSKLTREHNTSNTVVGDLDSEVLSTREESAQTGDEVIEEDVVVGEDGALVARSDSFGTH